MMRPALLRRRSVRSRPGLVMACTLLLGLAACGDGETTGPASPGAGTTVAVTLQEFSVLPSQDSAPAGEVTLEAENTGPHEVHELVVILTDLGPDALPTAEDGSVDEAGEGIEVLGEIEQFTVGETRTLTLDMEAGDYVFVCNVVEVKGEETEAHYALGMRTAFTVA